MDSCAGVTLSVVRGPMEMLMLLDVTPPDATVTVAVPAFAISSPATVAVSCVGLTNVVGSADPSQSTTAPAAKPLPFTASVNPSPPAVAEGGLRGPMTGVGALMGNVTGVEVTFP